MVILGMDNSIVINATKPWISDLIKEWSTDLTVLLEEWLNPQLSLVGDAKWGAKIRDIVKLPIEDPLKWANAFIPIENNNWVIAGIRGRGRNINETFVEIITTSLKPEVSQLHLLNEALTHYKDFSPLCLRVFVPYPLEETIHINASSKYSGCAREDLLIVAGLLSELIQKPKKPMFEKIKLNSISAEMAFHLTKNIYAEIAEKIMNVYEWAKPIEMDTLLEVSSKNLLFSINYNSKTIGIIACLPENNYGLNGFLMHEICIQANFQGQGFGAAALQHLAEILYQRRTTDSQVLWGHIHSQNKASLQNALSIGRQIVGGHVWLTPEGYPGMPV